jgi:hypothetical protein
VIRGGTEDGVVNSPPAKAQSDVVVASWKAMAVGFIFAAIFVALCNLFSAALRAAAKA